MKTETIVMIILSLILGMLLANMLKDICGCRIMEGLTQNEKCQEEIKNIKTKCSNFMKKKYKINKVLSSKEWSKTECGGCVQKNKGQNCHANDINHLCGTTPIPPTSTPTPTTSTPTPTLPACDNLKNASFIGIKESNDNICYFHPAEVSGDPYDKLKLCSHYVYFDVRDNKYYKCGFGPAAGPEDYSTHICIDKELNKKAIKGYESSVFDC